VNEEKPFKDGKENIVETFILYQNFNKIFILWLMCPRSTQIKNKGSEVHWYFCAMVNIFMVAIMFVV
jgi:hypothetical protein